MRASSLSGRIYSTIVEELVHMLEVAYNVGMQAVKAGFAVGTLVVRASVFS
jgi:hypothetical protein